MTALEALKTKYEGTSEKGELLLCFTVEQLNVVKTALTHYETLKQRDTAMKVNNYDCLNCKGFVPLHAKFCPHCGQRLDWGK